MVDLWWSSNVSSAGLPQIPLNQATTDGGMFCEPNEKPLCMSHGAAKVMLSFFLAGGGSQPAAHVISKGLKRGAADVMPVQ